MISDDEKVRVALTTNMLLFLIALLLYWLFHCKKRASYYTNPIKRGFGPVRSCCCCQCLPLIHGDPHLTGFPRSHRRAPGAGFGSCGGCRSMTCNTMQAPIHACCLSSCGCR